jgi:hypothetical protein
VSAYFFGGRIPTELIVLGSANADEEQFANSAYKNTDRDVTRYLNDWSAIRNLQRDTTLTDGRLATLPQPMPAVS